jgi:hypothetical protein
MENRFLNVLYNVLVSSEIDAEGLIARHEAFDPLDGWAEFVKSSV